IETLLLLGHTLLRALQRLLQALLLRRTQVLSAQTLLQLPDALLRALQRRACPLAALQGQLLQLLLRLPPGLRARRQGLARLHVCRTCGAGGCPFARFAPGGRDADAKLGDGRYG
ncbi:MAG: hypothetical protein N2688_02460, partial [Burkholderiaceae bacterium]|nr:hypothetical protein [Burkholderiaceae bacterium]